MKQHSQKNILRQTLRYLAWIILVFKRLKSLLELGSIPTKTEEAGEAWINGKILLSLLTEKYLGDTDFSPSRDIRSESEYMERNEAGKFYNIYDDTTKYTDNVFRYSKTGGGGVY